MSAECVAESIPSGYKQTEVGVIPEDWDVGTLDSLIEPSRSIRYGIVQPGKFDPCGRYMVRGQDYSGGWVDPMELFRVSAIVEERYANARIKAGDILITIVGASTGKVVIVPSWLDGANLTQTTARIAVNDSKANSTFCSYVLSSWYGVRQVQNYIKGGAQPGLNCGDIEKFLIPLPPTKTEQESIAEALSDADALIESLEQLTAKKLQIKQGAMQELLTGKRRLPEFSGEWEMHNLRRFVRSFIVPMRDKPKRFAGDIPWCRIEDFDGIYLSGSKSDQRVDIETIHTMNLKVYPTGTLLVSCSADLGRCAIVARPLVSNQTFIGLGMDETVSSNLFFYYYMTSKADELNNLSSGTTISYLSREQFEEFSVFVPCDKKEQNAIATILWDMDSEITVLEEKLAKSRQLKQGMMQELLTGRIRLI